MTDEAILDSQRHIWSLGDYSALARHLLPISEDVVAEIGISAGQRVLDIAVGDGNTSSCAARAGADVVGIDLTPAQLDLARVRLAAEGLTVELHEWNAEHLEFEDASFDAVVSSMGVIFAPDQASAAAEMARVVRPGGRIGLTAWAGAGWSTRMWAAAGDLLPPSPPGGPRSEVWGDPVEAERLLRDAGSVDIDVRQRDFTWDFPSVDEGATFLRTNGGPYVAMFAAAEARGRLADLEALFEETIALGNAATDGTCSLPAPYLVVTAVVGETRRP